MGNDQKSIVLLSGGLDSTTLLYYVVKRRRPASVRTLHFDFGFGSPLEQNCAKWHSDFLACDYTVLNAKQMCLHIDPNLIRGIPYTMSMLCLGLKYADALGYEDVHTAVNLSDKRWGVTETLIDGFRDLLAGKTLPKIESPFQGMTRSQLLRIAIELGVETTMTWSCLKRDADKPCGRCLGCMERIAAFANTDLTRSEAMMFVTPPVFEDVEVEPR